MELVRGAPGLDTIEPKSNRNYNKFTDISRGGIQAPDSDQDSDEDANSNKNNNHNSDEEDF